MKTNFDTSLRLSLLTPQEARELTLAGKTGESPGDPVKGIVQEEAGVAAIPYSALYESGKAPDHYVRFSFCKYDESLDEAADRLARHFARS